MSHGVAPRSLIKASHQLVIGRLIFHKHFIEIGQRAVKALDRLPSRYILRVVGLFTAYV